MTRPPVALKRRIASELRALRERKGLTLEAAAQRAEVTKSSLSRFENGHSAPKIHTLRALMAVYGAPAQLRSELEDLTREAGRRGWRASLFGEGVIVPEWLRTYVGLEATASALSIYSLFVPHLLQTADYASATLAAEGHDPDTIVNRLQLLAARQQLLTGADSSAAISVVVDESAICRQVGNRAVLREQITALAAANERPNLSVRILPFVAGRTFAAAGGGFVTLELDPDPPLVFLETCEVAQFVEGETYVRRFREVFERLSEAALPPEETSDFLVRVAKSLTDL
ncbi:helix-turn-helix transcriptional regulator [Solwaraspora sp. WMMD791]|uniref:helix-turn-helix domain-containing protein n=1 Tax=Solwaraspora sp. WMMD791 TaxID=3016086 RepID=UPI00249B0650|nr:helix-turn-helix transcriptional regulator [Solwaraspora sp. WMMD791]WFE25013.1 helix-turn-helix transcriptional regulator [Solwaraspora sp. WMMD791]